MSVVGSNILAGSSGQSTGYDIDQSLRFDDGDSAYLSRTPGSAGNRRTWTLSWWEKKTFPNNGYVYSQGTNGATNNILIGPNDTEGRLWIREVTSSSADVFGWYVDSYARDPAAWYHFVVAVDTTQVTSTDRVKIYINGVQQTLTAAGGGAPSLNLETELNNTTTGYIGAWTTSGAYKDGYLAEVHLIDGTALDASSFGETDAATNQWKPIEATGLTYGTNGFYEKYSATELANSFTDSSSSAHTITANGDVANTRAQYKVGDSSIYFPNGSDYLSIPDSADWDVGTGDFTIEAWTNFTNSGADNNYDNIFKQTGAFQFARHEPSNNLYMFTGSNYSASTTAPLADGTWRHVAVCRSSGTIYGYVDGVSLLNYADSTDLDYASAVNIGSSDGTATWYLDELRFSNTARYPSGTTFTTFGQDGGTIASPTPFTADANTMLLIHSDFDGGLGADSSGNKNDFAVTNLVATDQVIDTPTNNYCTFNPNDYNGTSHPFTYSEGNTRVIKPSQVGNNRVTYATFGPTSDKWYWECLWSSGSYGYFGIGMPGSVSQNGAMNTVYANARQYSMSNGNFLDGSSDSSYGSGGSTGDIFQFAMDRDNEKVWIGVNGTWENSGDPVTGANPACSNLTSGEPFLPIAGDGSSAHENNFQYNFGQDSSFAGLKTAQGNGGTGEDFYYAPPTGFKALNTDNLSDPSIALPTDHFNSILWTGDGTSPRSFTGVGFTPDFTWTKNRGVGVSHMLYDTVRGAGSTKSLESNATLAEGGGNQATYGYLSAFGSDGFTTTDGSGSPNYYFNQDTQPFVAWNWKGGGAAVSNTDGSTTSSVSANTTAGFSIVKYAGNDTAGNTVGHGLSQAPELVITKNLGTVFNWVVSTENVTGTTDQYLVLNTDAAASTNSNYWQSVGASLLTFGDSSAVNQSSRDFIAYCIHSVEGYSKVGSYTGNGVVDGTFVYTGFRPAWLMIKYIDGGAGYSWQIADNKRNTYNVVDTNLLAESTSAEGHTWSAKDFVSNGFKLRTTNSAANGSSLDFLYIAFAESPFKYSNAR